MNRAFSAGEFFLGLCSGAALGLPQAGMVDAVGVENKAEIWKAESRNLSAKGANHTSLGHRPRNMGQTGSSAVGANQWRCDDSRFQRW